MLKLVDETFTAKRMIAPTAKTMRLAATPILSSLPRLSLVCNHSQPAICEMELPPSKPDSTGPECQGESHKFLFETSVPRGCQLGEIPGVVS
jgi:hypothetical protein